jgi:hypothetical protein
MRRLLFLVALAVLVAACGGSSRLSKAQYQQKIQKDGNAVRTVIAAITKSGTSTSFSDFATKVDDAEAAVKKAADDLAAAKPPKDVEADNATVVTALRTIQTGLEKLKKAAGAGGSAAVVAAAAAIESSPQLKAAEKALGDMKAKGYKVGFLGT